MNKNGKMHIIIPDTQVKPNVNTDHLRHIGQYILDHKPEVIVHIGDHFDMPSLSSYDKGKKSFEGRRYKADIAAGIAGMEKLLAPIVAYNKNAKKLHRPRYKPEMHFMIGNHEQRIERAADEHPELDGTIGFEDFKLKEMGWNVHDFLDIEVVDGINYVHYIQSDNSPRAIGSAKMIAQKMSRSTIVGHQQSLDYHYLPSRRAGDPAIQAIISGAAYTHREEYRGNQGQQHFRGILRLSGVDGKGGFCPMFIDLDYLKRRYK